MSITRAIGWWIFQQTGVNAFCDASAHRWKTAPRVEVANLSEDNRALGPGRTVRWAGGVPTHFIKRDRTTTEIEITASCKTEEDGSSEAKCVLLAEQIKSELKKGLRSLAPLTWVDPLTSTTIPLVRYRLSNIVGAELDDTHQLHVHTAKLRMSVETRESVEDPVELIIERADNYHPEVSP